MRARLCETDGRTIRNPEEQQAQEEQPRFPWFAALTSPPRPKEEAGEEDDRVVNGEALANGVEVAASGREDDDTDTSNASQTANNNPLASALRGVFGSLLKQQQQRPQHDATTRRLLSDDVGGSKVGGG